MPKLKTYIKSYWSLIKSLQTFLLLITGIVGYVTVKCPVFNISAIILLTVSLFLTISGTTVLNMVLDRDIDAKMKRTYKRPIPSKIISPVEATILGVIILLIGLIIAFFISPLYSLIVFGGFFIDFVIYTIWLKRRTSWSILWGGISGGMPILAGRVLATGTIDLIGILLALSILLWIPTHILTFNLRHHKDYKKAGIPTFVEKYGFHKTRIIIAISSILTAISVCIGIYALGISWGYIRIMIILAGGSLTLALLSIFKPSEKTNFLLFKYASIFMLFSMLLIAIGSNV